jgi:hypothetical protein
MGLPTYTRFSLEPQAQSIYKILYLIALKQHTLEGAESWVKVST